MEPIKIILVDDHQIVRQGLASILKPDSRFVVIGEASTAMEALQLSEKKSADILILDLYLPDMSGVEVCQRISKIAPDTLIIILTAYFEHEQILACMRAGVKGFLLKDAEYLDLPNQLMKLYEGHFVCDPRVTDILAEFINEKAPPDSTLTLREMDVIRFISQGLSNREIGLQLHLSENTIKGYVKGIFAKLKAHNRVEAVAIMRKKGFL
jgi:two-component system, NarL family, response regulator DevR